ncbi:MAG: ABC transporter ATP-binding protein, partial [Akkermansiaceae bacterium]
MSLPPSLVSHPSSNLSPEILVQVDGLGKIFCRDLKQSLLYGLRDSAKDMVAGTRRKAEISFERKLRNGEFWANKGISFDLRRGECLGLIGHNGAGKTTLLKMLSGLIKPDAGSITMRGRIGALIALGAGFNPILTGRENIYINGSVLGLSKEEIDERLDDIIDFAELRDFIDSPVQSYSSGMSVRLGFSIASSLKPDILILDEVLAVGDVGFVTKCLNRVRELTNECAVIFVSHHMQFVANFCTRVMVLDQGQPVIDASNPADGINCYFGQMNVAGNEFGSGRASLDYLNIISDDSVCEHDQVLKQGDEIAIDLTVTVGSSLQPVKLTVFIDDEMQSHVIHFPLLDKDQSALAFESGSHQIRIP